jgi:hypothetical protein
MNLLLALLRPVFRRWPPRVLTILVLLLAMAVAGANGLGRLLPPLEPGLLRDAAWVGVWLAWWLAGSRLTGWYALPLLAALGGIGLMARVGRLGDEWLTLVQALGPLGLRAFGPKLHLLPEGDETPLGVLYPLGEAAATWLEGHRVIFLRLIGWLRAAQSGDPVFDPLAAALVWALTLWLAAAWLGWITQRHAQPLLGALPLGGMLAFGLYYTNTIETGLSSLLFFACALAVLQAVCHFSTRARRWRKADLPEVYDSLEWIMTVGGIVLALTILAGAAPSVSVQQIARAVQQALQPAPGGSPRLAESLGLQPTPDLLPAFQQARRPALPNLRLLSGGQELSQSVVMQVSLAGYEPLNPQAIFSRGEEPVLPPRYYWRSMTYDLYNGRGWHTSPLSSQSFGANAPVRELAAVGGLKMRIVQQTVHWIAAPDGFIYAAGELLSANAPYEVAWRGADDFLGAQTSAAGYTAFSRLPLVTLEQLRRAGSAYPASIQNRYLRLPDSLPGRVRDLALNLTASELPPYDRAAAIEAYLRSLPYSLDVPAPPAGRDAADYFLFDLQRGYCDYFATAMVVLARAAGLPARLVVGYAAGSYNPAAGYFLVTEAEAHSWVEVYFSEIGWVEFEPTGSRQPFLRPETIPVPRGIASNREGADLLGQGDLWGWSLALLAGMLAAALGVMLSIGQTALDPWRLQKMAPAAALRVLYRRVYRLGRRLIPAAENCTPLEFAANLGAALNPLEQFPRLSQRSAAAQRNLRTITDLYMRALFSQAAPTRGEIAVAWQAWRQLQMQLGWARRWRWALQRRWAARWITRMLGNQH